MRLRFLEIQRIGKREQREKGSKRQFEKNRKSGKIFSQLEIREAKKRHKRHSIHFFQAHLLFLFPFSHRETGRRKKTPQIASHSGTRFLHESFNSFPLFSLPLVLFFFFPPVSHLSACCRWSVDPAILFLLSSLCVSSSRLLLRFLFFLIQPAAGVDQRSTIFFGLLPIFCSFYPGKKCLPACVSHWKANERKESRERYVDMGSEGETMARTALKSRVKGCCENDLTSTFPAHDDEVISREARKKERGSERTVQCSGRTATVRRRNEKYKTSSPLPLLIFSRQQQALVKVLLSGIQEHKRWSGRRKSFFFNSRLSSKTTPTWKAHTERMRLGRRQWMANVWTRRIYRWCSHSSGHSEGH